MKLSFSTLAHTTSLVAVAVAATAVACSSRGRDTAAEHVAFTSFADTTLSPEIPLTPAVLGDQQHYGLTPKIAASQSGYLVVWQDTLADREVVLAARLDTTARMIEPAPRVLASYDQSYQALNVAVGSDGTDYLVTWSSPTKLPAAYVGLRVRAANGIAVDPAPIALANQTVYSPTITYSGQTYVLAYEASASYPSYDVRVQRLSGGQALEALSGKTLGQVTTNGTSTGSGFAIAASTDDQVFVAWSQFGVRMRASDGSVLDKMPVQYSKRAAGGSPVAAFGAGNYTMVWQKGSTVYAGRVRTSDGVALDPDDEFNQLAGSIVLATNANSSAADGSTRVAAADGVLTVGYPMSATWGAFLATLAVDPATGHTVVADGGPAYTTIGVPTDYVFALALGGGSAAVLVSATGGSTSPDGLYATGLTRTGGLLFSGSGASMALDIEGQTATAPAIASNGTDYLAMWKESRGGATGIYAARVGGASHAVLDSAAIQIGDGNLSTQPIGSDGAGYLAAWISGYNVYARPIAADGTLGNVITVYSGSSYSVPSNAVVTCDGVRYLVAWADNGYVYGARVDAASHAVLDTSGIDIAYAGTVAALSATVDAPSDPTRKTFFVTWSTTGSPSVVRGARVRSALGSAIDANAPLTIASRASATGNPLTVSDGTYFFVVWDDRAASATTASYYGTRVVPLDGSILDKQGSANGVLVAAPTASTTLGGLAWDGRSVMMALVQASASNASRFELVGARLSPTLTLLDPPADVPGFVIQEGLDTSYAAVALGARAGGESLAAYSSVVMDPEQLGVLIRGRALINDGMPKDAGADVAATDTGAPDGASDAGEGGVTVSDAGVDASEGGTIADAEAADDAIADAAEDAAAEAATDAAMDAAADAATEAGTSPGTDDGGASDASTPADGATAADAASNPAAHDGSSGCGCRVGSSPPASWPTPFGLAAVAAALGRRRSRRRA